MTPSQPSSSALRQLADLSDIRGDSAAAADLRRTAGSLEAHPARLSLPGRWRTAVERRLGRKMGRIIEYLTTGETDMALRAARARIPWLLQRLMESSAIGTSEAAALARAGIVTFSDLTSALDEERVSGEFGAAADARLRDFVDRLRSEGRPVPLGHALDIVEALVECFAACPPLQNVTAAGGVRRYEPLVDDLVIVGTAADTDAAIDAVAALPVVDDVLYRTGRRLLLAHRRTEIDFRVSAPAEYGTLLHGATGSRAHLVMVAARNPTQRLRPREEDVYADADLAYIPPELRQGAGEIASAVSRRLPALIDLSQIRGDLHMHTVYSDGQDGVESMVAASCALGYAYIAITDHSERAGASRTLTLDMLARQRDEIARLRERYPSIAILHGIEVDIMPDGRLDFPDAVLARLDIVLASLHDAARQDARELTRRCIGAIRHPLVTILTHPTNRIVGRRPEYPLDFDAVYAAAAETGTALEVDGAPAHLDLDGEHARAAVAAGVTVVIDSDSHRAVALRRQMRMGVGTARRGWVEAANVLNARSLEDVQRFISAKRGSNPN